MDSIVLAEKIERICAQHNEFPTKACAQAGVGKDFLTKLKRGQKPSFDKVQRIAAHFGMTSSALLGEEKPPESEDNGRSAPAGGVCEETRVAMELLSKLNPENLASAIDYLQFRIAKQKEAEGKK